MASGESQQTATQEAMSVPSLLPTSSSGSGARPSNRVASPKINKGDFSIPKIPESESPTLHSCVLRLRVEDRFLAEDVRESLDSPKDRFVASHLASQVEDLYTASTARPVSPSPLGTSTRSAASHSPPLVWETRILNPALNSPSTPFHLAKNSAKSILQH